MVKQRSNKRKTRALNTMREKAFALCAIGLALLIVPLFMGSSPMLKTFANGVRLPGWAALVLGAALLGVHYLAKAKATKSNPEPQEMAVTPNAHQPETTWTAAVFAAIEWRRFEAVCESLFGQAGFETKSQSHGADGGVDIWLHSRNAKGPVAVVQCKHWQGKAVGVKELREFYGVMASHQLKRGTYATTSTYTTDAAQFAKDNGINAMDGKALLALIAKRTPEQQQALLAVAFKGEYWRPTCASCGIKLVERAPAKGGANFWGCSNYPRCASRLPMVASLR